jgi:alpha-methylacyl-CoA racemase
MDVLTGIRIVEIAGIGPGPFCAMHLADLGADVITVQPPFGGGGSIGPETCINRGKRTIVLDLKSDKGRDYALRLIEGADALIEGMRPGAMERVGLGPEACHSRNARLVFGRMTGWGQSGPLSRLAAHDANYISVSGALWHSGSPGQPPVTPFSVVGDIAGGALYLAVGILGGVINARRTGKGCVVVACVVDGSAHSLHLLLAGLAKGLISEERGKSLHDASHFYATYRCADGGFLTVAAIEPKFYSIVLERLGLKDDPSFARQWDRELWSAQKERLQGIFATRARDEWCSVFEGTDACVAPVLSPMEAASYPHNVSRGVYFQREGFLQAAPAPRFDGEISIPGPILRYGQHT